MHRFYLARYGETPDEELHYALGPTVDPDTYEHQKNKLVRLQTSTMGQTRREVIDLMCRMIDRTGGIE